MRGRPRKPLALRIAEGDTRGRGVHKLDAQIAAEPQAEKGIPPCPSRLKGLARAAYIAWSDDLENMGLNCKPDGPMLEGACVAFATAVKAGALVEKHGPVYEEPVTNERGKIVGYSSGKTQRAQ